MNIKEKGWDIVLFPWAAQLPCSRGMPAGVGGWGIDWNEVREGKLEEKIFVSHWGWNQRGKETIAGIMLWGWRWNWGVGTGGAGKAAASLPALLAPLAFGLTGAPCWDQAASVGGKLGGDHLWDPQEMGGRQAGWEGRLAG